MSYRLLELDMAQNELVTNLSPGAYSSSLIFSSQLSPTTFTLGSVTRSCVSQICLLGPPPTATTSDLDPLCLSSGI